MDLRRFRYSFGGGDAAAVAKHSSWVNFVQVGVASALVVVNIKLWLQAYALTFWSLVANGGKAADVKMIGIDF